MTHNPSRSTGALVLEGGAEFGGQMASPDRRALELAGGLQAQVVVMAAAAAPDHNHQRAGNNGLRWFRSLGAVNVRVSGLIDRESSNRAEVANELRQARLIYLLGGFPGYLAETLAGSRSWDAILEAWRSGAVIAGSSAGAMVLCEQLYDPAQEKIISGLGLLPGTCFLPHHNTFGRAWASRLGGLLPDQRLLGVDERTGLVWDGQTWQVLGAGRVVLYQGGGVQSFKVGEYLPEGSLPPIQSD